MSQCEATRQGDWILPMINGTDGKGKGAVLATSGTPAAIDLTTIPGPPWPTNKAVGNPNVLGHYVDFHAETVDCYVNFGPTQASVSGANAPDPTKTGTNVVALANLIPTGAVRSAKLPVGDASSGANGANSMARWMGYVTAGSAGYLRVAQSDGVA